MALIKQIKTMEGMTGREKDICKYILECPEKIMGMSSRELGKETFTSAASVTRFCQKLGLKGFAEFKLKFVSELSDIYAKDKEEKISMSEHENAVTMVRKVTEIQRQAVEDTRKEISYSQIIRVGKMIAEASSVDFYAYDTNVYLAQYGCTQFFHAGKLSSVYSATNMQALQALMPLEGHVAIVISHTGENERLMEIAKLLKRKGTKVIVIASDYNRTLPQFADEYLHAAAPKSVEELWGAMFFASGKYILDILYGLEFSRRYEENLKLNERYEKSGKSTLWRLMKDV